MLRAIHKLCAQMHNISKGSGGGGASGVERLTAARERNNPLFAFLVDHASPYRAYYEYARFIQPMVAEEEKLIEERKKKQKQAEDGVEESNT
jgi:hypothetical protein